MYSFGYKPIDIANWFICDLNNKTGASVTNLKLQKLLYYAQAWTIVFFNKALFDEDFQAWAYGPVLTSIYYNFKDLGNNVIPAGRHKVPDLENTEIEELLKEVLSVYGDKSGYHLIELTHNEKPWIEARGNLSSEEKCNSIIKKTTMKTFYQKKLEEVNGKS